MLRFSVNLSLLFTEYPLLERFQQARAQGFQAVEIQFPYELPAIQIQQALEDNQLQLVLFNVAADDLLQGGEGLAAVPEKQESFQVAVGQALEYAEVLKPQLINVLPGRCVENSRRAEYLKTFKENLHFAADAFAGLGIKVVFEAINSIDMPGFLIDSSAKMQTLLAELNHPNLGLQYDIYHLSMMGEDCAAFLRRHSDKIGHIQFADCPGRGQPGSGTLDFDSLFEVIAHSGYQGWVGAEYKPQGRSADSLAWFTPDCSLCDV